MTISRNTVLISVVLSSVSFIVNETKCLQLEVESRATNILHRSRKNRRMWAGRYKWDYALSCTDLDRGCRIPIVYVIPMKWKEGRPIKGYIYIIASK